MPDPIFANYVFLPWVRQGAASGIQDTDSRSPTQAAVVSVPVKLLINDSPEIEKQLRLYGPGDVTGIDPLQVVRTEPRHLAMDFEPNYFPAIDFDRPDFPWIFTPAKADADGKLRPWLCLIVVRKQDGVTLRVDRSLAVAVLDIKAPALPKNELPDLSESWAWAHTQVMGSQPQDFSLRQSLGGDPALTVSRLLCPRRLDRLTDYFACVVPTFEVGSKAALGLPIAGEDEKMKPAWNSGDKSPSKVTLPVYFHWEFRTGEGGDFESLAGLLTARDAREMPKEVGKRPMDISQPGFQITPPPPPDATLELEGALKVLNGPTVEWPKDTRTPFQADLKKILEAPWQAMKNENKEPLVAPPIYGCWQASRHTVEIGPTPPTSTPWLDELNLDPRHRAVAALGTVVVQTQQEQLMASAWDQLGEVRINQMKRQAQLGRAVNAVYHAKHFSRFSDETLLKVVASGQSRIVVEASGANTTRTMLSSRIRQSALPDRVLSAPLRRMTSASSRISRSFQASAAPISIVNTLNTIVSLAAREANDAGLGLTIDKVSDDQTGPFATRLKEVIRFERVSNALTKAPGLGDFKIVNEGSPKRSILDFVPESADSTEAAAFREAAKAHHKYLVQSALLPPQSISAAPFDLSKTRTALLKSLDPKKTIAARIKASLGITASTPADDDALEPILDAPEFPQPMYEALRDISQDFLLPGLEHVPPDTVMLLETNSKFVESFLVGLNSEMNRELLWRDYPTDQRSTYFQQFWDQSSANGKKDIEPISTWSNRKLGDNVRVKEKLVLLIRGELLRRYPNSVIYAVEAELKNGLLDLSTKLEKEKHPVFRGTLKPDVTFLGFDLELKDAIANPGWFFVIQQQPTEPCFGMDVAEFDKPLPPLATWHDLSWRHLVTTQEELNNLSHASIKTVLPDIGKGKWSRNSAHQAYITLQRPVRIAIHASQMIKQGQV